MLFGSRSLTPLVVVYGPRLLTLVLLTVLCWMLARWTWIVIAPSPPAVRPTEAAAIHPVAARDAIIKSGVFAPGGHNTQRDSASATALNLKLVGVLATTPTRERSLAIVNLNNKGNELFSEGKELAPGIVMHQIFKDHVIIRRQGTLERVDFPERPRTTIPASGFNLNVQQAAAGQYSFSRDTLNRALQDPAQLAQLGGVSVTAGTGVTIEQAPAGSLAQKLGLQPGDVIRLVNGEAVSSHEDLLRLYQKFTNTGQVTIEGSRNGAALRQTYTVTP